MPKIFKIKVFLSFKKIKQKINSQKFKINWRKKDLDWRLNNPKENYSIKDNAKGRFYINKKIFKIIDVNMGEFEKKYFSQSKKRNKNYNLVNIYIGLGKYLNKNSYFFNFPNFLKPSPLYFILKNLDKKDNNFKLKREDIFFQLMDLDVF